MKKATASINFEKVVGKIKPMHGIGQPPMPGVSTELFPYLTRANIPFSRLHDVGGWLGHGLYVDIPNIFRNFDADENDPASYDFAFTDPLITGLFSAGCAPYFRLGVTIENEHMRRSYRIFPPKDFEKWARVCEHIIRHYNEGWANGFRYGITYWEIWNEPDDCYQMETSAMWKGTKEEYYRLYSVTARHLKATFGNKIKVGGYGHCGVYEYEKDKALEGIAKETYIYDFTINFFHEFLSYQKETGAPIDFFSWHVYDNCHPTTKEDFTVIREHAAYVRKMLDHYGYFGTEHHLNEWNLWTDRGHRDLPIAAAKTLGFMLMMQNTSTDLMCYYDGGLGYSAYGGLFNPDTGHPYRAYYALAMFGKLYALSEQVEAHSSDAGVHLLAARKGRRAVVVLSNPGAEPVSLQLAIQGFPTTEAQVLRIDEENRYTATGEALKKEPLFLPPYGCIQVDLWDIDN